MLRLNAVSCLIFGALFVAMPRAVAAVLGDPPHLALWIIGFGLVINGLHLFVAAIGVQVRRDAVLWFSLGDLSWWAGSMALLASGQWVTTGLGIVLTSIVAVGVAGLGLAQLFWLGMTRSGVTAASHWRRIGASWMAMKPWVKIWLFALNCAFLASFAVMPSDLFRVTIAAYVASGPLLLAFAFHQGGLSRATGIGHLIPWTPLLLWALDGLAAGAFVAAEAGYAVVLCLLVAICLDLDLYDLRRWIAGDKGLIRQPFFRLTAE